MILDFNNIFFLSNSLLNLASLALLHNDEIYHGNKNKKLYNLNTKKILV